MWLLLADRCFRYRQQIESDAALPARTALLTAADRVGPLIEKGSRSASRANASACLRRASAPAPSHGTRLETLRVTRRTPRGQCRLGQGTWRTPGQIRILTLRVHQRYARIPGKSGHPYGNIRRGVPPSRLVRIGRPYKYQVYITIGPRLTTCDRAEQQGLRHTGSVASDYVGDPRREIVTQRNHLDCGGGEGVVPVQLVQDGAPRRRLPDESGTSQPIQRLLDTCLAGGPRRELPDVAFYI